MIQPRPYQAESVYTLIPNAFRAGHTSVIRYAPMRSGKSIEQALMIKGAYEKGSRVVALTHRSKIFKSTLRHLGNAGVPCVEFEAGSRIPVGDWRVMLAMERSLWNAIVKNPDLILQPNLLIIDEIHLRHFEKIIIFFQKRAVERGERLFIVAFSGTPKGKHLYKYFTQIIVNVDSLDLIASGDIVPCRAYQAQDKEIDMMKKDKGEFDLKEMFEHYDKAKRYNGLIKEYRDKCNGLKGIVFCVNIEHTVKTYEAFKADGVNAFICHSGNKEYPMTEKESDAQIEAFEASLDGVMINQGKLDTGYDHSAMMWVGIDRATASLQLFLQMATRACTPHPGKTESIILDFGMNHTRHGLIHQPRKWELKEPKKKKEQAAPVRTCDGCGAMVYASARKCEHCGFEFPIPTTELRNGIMVLYESNTPVSANGKKISELSLSELIECQRTKKITSQGVWRIIRTKESRRALKPCPECQTRSRVFADGECTCHAGVAPCSFCEGSCLECKNVGYVNKTLEELEATPHYLREYASAMDYSQGWVMFERKKIQDGDFGFRDETIR